MSSAAAVSVPALLDKVRRIEPVLRQCVDENERERRLSATAFQAMRDQGLYRLWSPKDFGGLEVDPVTAYQVFEELARIDSAAAWNLQLACGAQAFGPWFDDRGAQEIFGDPDEYVAGSFFPPRKAVPVEGGYRVTGQSAFVSGAHEAAWFIGLAHIYAGDAPKLAENGAPVGLMVACPAADAAIVDNWRTLGMRGTGSHDVLMQDLFVPARRTALLAPYDRPGAAYGGPLYKLTLWTTVSALSTVALGIARAALDDLIAVAARKAPSYTMKPLRDRDTVQAVVGEANAALSAARAYLHEAAREAWEYALEGHKIDMPHKMKLQLAATHAGATGAKVIDLVHSAVGTTGIREEHRFQRHFRDAHTITQHGFISPSRYESGGQYLLGVPVEWPFYGL
jgi:indole-3-acetate monooxygenase